MPRDPEKLSTAEKARYLAVDVVARAVIGVALALPYATRVAFAGRAIARVIGPAAGWQRQAEERLAFVYPDMEPARRRAIARSSLDNMGRTLIENYSTKDLLKRMEGVPIDGPGFAEFEAAAARGQPVILVTGHFGNYEAVRAALVLRGYAVGGLYRNLANPYFNAHYVQTMQAFGGPVFPQGRKGTAGFVRHLRAGGQLVLLFDQYVHGAPILNFLGHPAPTAVSAAELAIRYDALLIPFYAIRRENGLDFDCLMDAPVPHSDPETMTQQLNDGLSARIHAHPDQWLWVPRRWRARNRRRT